MNLVAGIHPVEILLRETPSRVKTLYFLSRKKSSNRIQRLLEQARSLHIPVVEVSPDKIPAFDIPHQGIWARVPEFSYTSFKEWLAIYKERTTTTLLILDSITDPHNLGAIIRSAACLGCQGILIPKDRSASVTTTVWKASAGSVTFLPILRETNLTRCVRQLKEAGFWIFGTRMEGGIPLHEASWGEKSAIVLGSEEKGIRPLLASHCDLHLSIPMIGGLVTSLNVSVAAGIVLYERSRDLEISREGGNQGD
jgi:23S rRNA (guanosine2251-2'-O)-methyltransferase